MCRSRTARCNKFRSILVIFVTFVYIRTGWPTWLWEGPNPYGVGSWISNSDKSTHGDGQLGSCVDVSINVRASFIFISYSYNLIYCHTLDDLVLKPKSFNSKFETSTLKVSRTKVSNFFLRQFFVWKNQQIFLRCRQCRVLYEPIMKTELRSELRLPSVLATRILYANLILLF